VTPQTPLPATYDPCTPLASKAIATLRRKLIDLSLRNPLLNFKHTARSRRFVRIVDDSIDRIFSRLNDEGSFHFVPLPTFPTEPPDERTPDFQSALDRARLDDDLFRAAVEDLGDDPSERALQEIENSLRQRVRERLGMSPRPTLEEISLQDWARRCGVNPAFELTGASTSERSSESLYTLLFPDQLDRHLRRIAEQTRLAVEETGVHTLYLACGFLEWYEADSSEQALLAPLLLCPTELRVEVRRGSYIYTLSSIGEPAFPNLPLLERLRAPDIGIALPELISDDDLRSYFATVADTISSKKHWRVRHYVTLSRFAFARLVMYQDLDEAQWPLGESPAHAPLIRHLFCGVSTDGVTSHEDTPVDEPPISDLVPPPLTDCDSSQQRAIADALQDRSLVIEGPPGTGKSQTITNLIGAALHAGKTVLFVAEKLAALEVVHKRLQDAGLAPFCLELHSTKARRQDLVTSLKTRLQVRRTPYESRHLEDARLELEQARVRLRDHVYALSQPCGAFFVTVHTALWATRCLRDDHPDLAPHLANVSLPRHAEVTPAEYQRVYALLQLLAERYESCSSPFGVIAAHPWLGLPRPDLDALSVEDLLATLGTCHRDTVRLLEDLRQLEQHTGLAPRSLAEVSNVIGLLRSLPAEPLHLLRNPRLNLGDPSQCEALQSLRRHLRALLANQDCLDATLTPPAFPNACWLDTLSDISATVDELAVEDLAVSDIENEIAATDEDLSRLHIAQRVAAPLLVGLGLEEQLDSPHGLTLAVQAGRLLREAHADILATRQPQLLQPATASLLRTASVRAARLWRRRDHLSGIVHIQAQVSPEDLLEYASTLQEAGIFPFLSRRYRKALRAASSVLRIDPRSETGRAAAALRDLAAYTADRVAFELDPHLGQACGSRFFGLDTDFPLLDATITWCSRVVATFSETDGMAHAIRRALLDLPADHLISLRDLAKDSELIESHQVLSDLATSPSIARRLEQLSHRSQALASLQALLRGIPLRPSVRLSSLRHITSVLSAHESLIRAISTVSWPLDQALFDSIPLPDLVPEIDTALGLVDSILSNSTLSPETSSRILTCLSSADLTPLRNHLDQLEASQAHLAGSLDAALPLLAPSPPVLLSSDTYRNVPLSSLADHLHRALAHPDALSDLVDYLRVEMQVRDLGLGQLLDVHQRSGRPPSELPIAYKLTLYQDLSRLALATYPELKAFDGAAHQQLRQRYQQLDREIMILQQKRLQSILARRSVDPGNSTGRKSDWTGQALIENEIRKQRRFLPIRALFERAGTAIQQLKPCLLMSPLSVAQFLKPGSLHFDLVIMDEASQLRPEDALGALTRATTMVIVGDPLQLPPTTFFDRATLDDIGHAPTAEDDDRVYEESILDLSASVLRSTRRLKWHYRSRHESLIAFSNREFYDNQLILYPSAVRDDLDLGVRLVFVEDGRYQSGASLNVPEMKRVMEAVVDFVRRRPDLTLGVVSMNEPQRELLLDEFDRLLLHDPELAAYVEKWANTLEPLFIKNLENVQGDERDVIMISTVYGRDELGNLHQRFGPINNRQAGHRRLNVLFTRARWQTVIFSSLDPDLLRVDHTSARGLRALKGFLTYAKTGRLEGPSDGGSPSTGVDSAFELYVARALRASHYEVVPQVGVAGYFIDLGVRHPERPGTFILGVECDGATYHSAPSVRDRDRLRQDILERLGWRIYRIWSVDWFRNPRREMGRLLAHLAALRAAPFGTRGA
jgi:very-short-patch-repair endonuclease